MNLMIELSMWMGAWTIGLIIMGLAAVVWGAVDAWHEAEGEYFEEMLSDKEWKHK